MRDYKVRAINEIISSCNLENVYDVTDNCIISFDFELEQLHIMDVINGTLVIIYIDIYNKEIKFNEQFSSSLALQENDKLIGFLLSNCDVLTHYFTHLC